jgi:CheY-like chemotaxis protein
MEKRPNILLVDDSKETVDGLKSYLDRERVFTERNAEGNQDGWQLNRGDWP